MFRAFRSVIGSSRLKLATPAFTHVRVLPAARPARHFGCQNALRNEPKKGTGKVPLGSFKVDKPQLMIAFTCKKCDNRSSHTMSKQAYTKGTVLIQCPGCKSRHLIADHLKIFSDDHITVEDILKAKGESVSLSTEDLAFEDIPEKLKEVIGHHAKDAPAQMRGKLA